MADLKAAIAMNAISDLPVRTVDIDLAEKIFGPDIGHLKGKSTRQKPVPVVNDVIEVPPMLIKSQQNVTLCIDGMTVNGLVFLTTISRNLYYRTAQFIPHETTEQYKTALTSVIRCYNVGGFRIAKIHADNEFRPLLEPLQDEFRVEINFANPQDHVPEAERNNRTLKERTRATYHRLPYHTLTRTMVKILVQESAKKLNFFPARHGVSQFYSPRMILHQRNLQYNKHCKYSFGSFVEAAHDPNPKNTNAPRTLDCIYLRYHENDQGGHQCLHLQTNRIITRAKVTPVPITAAVINQVRTIATQENMPDGLKIKNKYDVVLYDSAWIAGVDYDAEEESESEDDETYIASEEDEDDDDELDDEDDNGEDDDDDEDNDNDDAENAGVHYDDAENAGVHYDEMRFHYDEIADEEENETESEHENDHSPNGPTLAPQLGTPLRNEESNPTTVEQAETTEQEEEEENKRRATTNSSSE